MLRTFVAALAAFAICACEAAAAPASSSAPPASSAAPDLDTAKGQKDFLAHLAPRWGSIPLSQAGATLELGKAYYFLDPADSRKVLVEVWNNPKDFADGILGMVFPAGQTPLDPDGWGVVVTYQDTGYVSDKDARKTDYGKVLKQLSEANAQADAERKKENLKPIHLVGWGEAPSYDAAHHSLVWARELEADGVPDHLLNYDLRLLGRRGVLSLNVVATMKQLPQIRTAASQLQGVAAFQTGSRYADYQPKTDKRAAFGLAGLILAGAGLAVAKKAGLIAIGLIVLKKGFVFIVAGLSAAIAWVRKQFGGRKSA